MKNFNISKSNLYNIKNINFLLIDTDIAKIINLIHVYQFVQHQSPNYWTFTVYYFGSKDPQVPKTCQSFRELTFFY